MNETDDWRRDVDPARTAFFLDVDGTLLGFKDRPEDVVADPELLDLLLALQSVADGAIALVSGRAIPDLDRIMTPLVLPAGGVHGADLRFADGRCETAEAGALADLRAAATDFVANHEGLSLEDKGSTIAIHYRRAPAFADAVKMFFDEQTVELHDLMVQHGKMVVEAKSRYAHKGTAIETLMQDAPFAGRCPLFMGDDLTDEHGFETINRLGGISIKIGEESDITVAGHRLPDLSAVREFLSLICQRSHVK